MWERLAPEERDLIMVLTPFYTLISSREYEDRFCDVWDMAVGVLPPETQNVALVDIPKMGSRGGPKSHDSLFYRAKTYDSMLRLSHLRVSFLSSFRQYKGDGATTFAFLDDYVGTGDTIVKALELLRQRFPAAEWNAVFVLALAAQRQAVERLKAFDCTLVAGTVLGRGISDSSIADISDALRVMDKIGLRLGVAKSARLGYGKTEGVVSMMRTPNNTFPVFWTTKQVAGCAWTAPFPRITRNTSPDWGREDWANYPMPQSLGSLESRKVLECVRDQRDVEALVMYKISYARVLQYLRLSLSQGLVELRDRAFMVTPAGHAALSEEIREKKSRSREEPRTGAAGDVEECPPEGQVDTSLMGERKNLYVPNSLVR